VDRRGLCLAEDRHRQAAWRRLAAHAFDRGSGTMPSAMAVARQVNAVNLVSDVMASSQGFRLLRGEFER
jgi:hypothetical protein